MRQPSRMLLVFILLLFMHGCASFRQTTGGTKVLVPLSVPLDSMASCFVENFTSSRSSGLSLLTEWQESYRTQLVNSLEDKRIFASVASDTASSERYLATGILEAFDHVTSVEKTPRLGSPKSSSTYDREVREAVIVMVFALKDVQTGRTIFSMRAKSRGRLGQSDFVPFADCVQQFTSSLNEAIEDRRK
jgi:hypothetical protein